MAGFAEIGVTFLLILICALLSWKQQQRLEKDFVLGALRSFLQIILLGYILNWIFKHSTLPVILAISGVMTFNAALHARGRVKVRHRGLLLDSLVATVLAIWPLAFLGAALLHAAPLWRVDVFLPLLGMLLGNTMNGISQGIDFYSSELKVRSEEIFSLLALGASPKEATGHIKERAMKIAMTPMMNSMASMGLVSIPGMMTGQILAGAEPSQAAVSQVIIVFLITVGTYAGTSMALVFTRNKKFTQEGVPCFG